MSRIGPSEPAELTVAASRSLADLLWLANTAHGPGAHWFARPTADAEAHDHLAAGADAVRYLADHGVDVPPGRPDETALAGLRAVRDMVWGLAAGGEAWTADVVAIAAGARFRLGPDRRLAAEGEGWTAFVADLVPPLVALVDRRARLGVCRNPACRLVFLDGSKSGTRRWCDDGGCGNRIRLRRLRDRRGATAQA